MKLIRVNKRKKDNNFFRIAASVGYYGLSINTNNLGGNRYLACFLSGAMEIPANVFSYFGLKRLGGRISFMIMTGLSALCLLVTPPLFLGK